MQRLGTLFGLTAELFIWNLVHPFIYMRWGANGHTCLITPLHENNI
jgi:hypothetical protein